MKLCPTCRIGRLTRRTMAYIEWHGKNLLVVDNMPVQICDVCGDRDYDPQAVEDLQQLLWSNVPTGITSKLVSGRHT